MGVYAAGCALASVLPITLPGNILGMVLLLVLLFLGLMRVTAGTYSAFIYFQF